MYQVLFNEKYYVKDIAGDYYELGSKKFYINPKEVLLTTEQTKGKLFASKTEAINISTKIDGKVIKYIKMGDINV